MTKMKCKYCGAVFDLKDISTPMKGALLDFVWVRDRCPACHKGMDDWYLSDKVWNHPWNQREMMLRAIRYYRKAVA